MAVNQTTVLEDFSYSIGESSVPTSNSNLDPRKRFIQRTLEEAVSYANWDWNKATVTLALTSGVASLPSLALNSPYLDVRIVGSGTNDDNVFTAIPYEQQDAYGQGSYKYWLTGAEGEYLINSKEADATLTVRYDKVAAQINASITTDFPSSMVLAKGALRYYRASKDPEYDVAQDQAIFERGLEDLLSKQNRNRPSAPAKTRHDVDGTYIGMI